MQRHRKLFYIGGQTYYQLLYTSNHLREKTSTVESLRPGGTMLCVVSEWRRYSRKIFNGKTHPWLAENCESLPSNDLTYTVHTYNQPPKFDARIILYRVLCKAQPACKTC